jgi:hypothetical protein
VKGEFEKQIKELFEHQKEMGRTVPTNATPNPLLLKWIDEARKEFPSVRSYKSPNQMSETNVPIEDLVRLGEWFVKWFGSS